MYDITVIIFMKPDINKLKTNESLHPNCSIFFHTYSPVIVRYLNVAYYKPITTD